MGKLLSGSATREIQFDDRMLAQLKVAIVHNLRRSQSFPLSWQHDLEHGSGRSTIWIHESIPLQFLFEGNRSPRQRGVSAPVRRSDGTRHGG